VIDDRIILDLGLKVEGALADAGQVAGDCLCVGIAKGHHHGRAGHAAQDAAAIDVRLLLFLFAHIGVVTDT
jgi:hypothetical protein